MNKKMEFVLDVINNALNYLNNEDDMKIYGELFSWKLEETEVMNDAAMERYLKKYKELIENGEDSKELQKLASFIFKS